MLAEATNRYREDLTEILAQARKVHGSLLRLLPQIAASSYAEVSVEDATTQYEQKLRRKFLKLGDLLPYPEVQHSEVVARDLARRNPFKRDGSGYRDCLIWESIKKFVASQPTAPTCFVTANTRDFGTGPLPLSSLLAELPSVDSVRILSSIAAFNEEFVIPQLPPAYASDDSEQAQLIARFRVSEWLTANLPSILNRRGIKDITSTWPKHELGGISVTAVRSIEDLALTGSRRLAIDGLLIRLRSVVLLQTEVYVDTYDAATIYAWAHDRQVSLSGGGSDWVTGDLEIRMEIRVDLLLDVSSGAVSSSELIGAVSL